MAPTPPLHLFSPEVADDPHATYRQLREQCPVAKGDLGGHDVVLLSRYEDVLWALRHPEAFTSASGPQPRRAAAAAARGRPAGPHRLPPHPQPAVRAPRDREAGARRPRAGRRAARRLRRPRLVRLPRGVRHAAAVEHLPHADGPARRRPARCSSSGATTPSGPTSSPATSRAPRASAQETAHAISDYFRERIAERRAEPDDTLLSKIVHATDRRPAARRGGAARHQPPAPARRARHRHRHPRLHGRVPRHPPRAAAAARRRPELHPGAPSRSCCAGSRR